MSDGRGWTKEEKKDNREGRHVAQLKGIPSMKKSKHTSCGIRSSKVWNSAIRLCTSRAIRLSPKMTQL